MTEKTAFRNPDQLGQMLCEFCEKDGNRNQSAEGFCVECVTYFCGTCLKFHEKFHPTHTQQSTDNMPKDFYTRKCSIHPDEMIKFYCLSCDVTACTICKTDNHIQCVEIHHLPTLVKTFDEAKEFANIHNSLEQAKRKIIDLELSTENGKRKSEEYSTGIQYALKTERYKVTASFDELENKAEDYHTKDTSKLEKEEKKILLIKSEIQSVKSDMEIRITGAHRNEVFLATKEAQVKTEEILRNIKKIKENITEIEIGRYTYVPAEQVSAGKLTDITTKERTDSVQLVTLIVLVVFVLLECILLNGAAIKSNEIKLSFDTRQMCYLPNINWIAAITFPDNTVNLITTNNTLENHFGFYILPRCYIKHLMYEAIVRENVFGNDGPTFTCVTTVGDDKVAFLSSNGYVLLHKINSQSSQKRIPISTGGHHFVSRNNIFFILYSEEKEQRIESYDTDGHQLLNIDISNKIQVVSPWNIAVSPDQETMYITDVDVVIGFTKAGQIKGYYRHPNLLRPTGMTIDSAGYLYVCGYLSNNVFKISPDLSHGYELLDNSNDIDRPFSISYNEKENGLYVNSFKRKSLQVFKISQTCLEHIEYRISSFINLLEFILTALANFFLLVLFIVPLVSFLIWCCLDFLQLLVKLPKHIYDVCYK